MKNKKTIYRSFALTVLLVFAVITQANVRRTARGNALVLDIDAGSGRYSLGEPITVNFALANLTDDATEVSEPNVFDGSLKLYISRDGVKYQRYFGPMWDMVRVRKSTSILRSGDSTSATAKVQYNQVKQTSHLTPMYASRITSERLQDNWAIIEPGEYRLMAVYSSGRTTIESSPVSIVIDEPKGNDSIVWKRIKGSREFAYFLDTGDLMDLPETDEGQEFMRTAQDLINEIPDSRFTQELAEKLRDYENMLAELDRSQKR